MVTLMFAVSLALLGVAVGSQAPPPENFDMRETADWLRVSERTVADLVSKGDLPYFRVGRQIRINLEELRKWAKERSGDK